MRTRKFHVLCVCVLQGPLYPALLEERVLCALYADCAVLELSAGLRACR
jgi:hypothetical protein